MVVIGWDEAAWACEERAMTAVRVATTAITAMSTSVSCDLRTMKGYNGRLTGRQRPRPAGSSVLRPASDGCPGTVEAESTDGRRSGAARRQATGRSYGSPGSSCRGNGGNQASDPAPATSDASAVGPSRADGGGPADGASNSSGDHPPTVLSAVEPDRLRALLHTTRGPRIATPTDTMRMGNAARALSSVALWHSLTNSDHWARPVTSLAAGSGPAPIVTGSSSATIAASDPCPGPQVPPTAGGGSAVRSMLGRGRLDGADRPVPRAHFWLPKPRECIQSPDSRGRNRRDGDGRTRLGSQGLWPVIRKEFFLGMVVARQIRWLGKVGHSPE